MTATENNPILIPERPAPPDRATADDETLQALEQMLANPDERLLADVAQASRGPLDRCALMREMLERLDTLGAPGQRDVMGRIISLLVTAAEGATSCLGEGNLRTFHEQLERLRREAGRPWPDAAAFCRRAENLITMVEAPGSAP